MIIYVLVVLFPLFIGKIFDTRYASDITGENADTKKYRRKRWWFLFLAALPMFVLIAFRNSLIGADTSVYLKFFDQMVDTPWHMIFYINDLTYEFEPGFVLFEKILTLITHSPYVYQVIYSTIYFLSVVTFANEIEKEQFSFLFFFATLGNYIFMFTGVRQCIAISICLLSYKFVKERRLIPFLLLLVLAYTFHRSAILFLAVYFIYNRKINFINSAFYAAFGVIAYININLIQRWFNSVFKFDYDVELSEGGVIFLFIIICITAFSYFMVYYYKKQNFNTIGMLNVNVITLVLWIIRLATRVAERPSYYFLPFTAAALCYALAAPIKDKDKTVYKTVVYILCMVLFVYKLTTNFTSFIPYSTFF